MDAEFLKRFEVDLSNYAILLDATALQDHMHKEFSYLIRNTQTVYEQYQYGRYAEFFPLVKSVIDFIQEGMKWNKLDDELKAAQCADFAWATLNVMKELGAVFIDLAKAALVESVQEEIKEFIPSMIKCLCNIFSNPQEKLGMLIKLMVEIDALEDDLWNNEQAAVEKFHMIDKAVEAVVNDTIQDLKNMKIRELVKLPGKIATRSFLQALTTKEVLGFFGRLGKIVKCRKALKKFTTTEKLKYIFTPSKSRIGIVDTVKKEIKRLAPKAAKIPGITIIEDRGKIVIDEKVIHKIYKDRLSKLGFRAFAKRNLEHIRYGHYEDGANFISKIIKEGKIDAYFNHSENFIELAMQVCEKGVKIGKDKYFCDFGRYIGCDKFGNLTSKVEVCLVKTLDGVRTTYPVPMGK